MFCYCNILSSLSIGSSNCGWALFPSPPSLFLSGSDSILITGTESFDSGIGVGAVAKLALNNIKAQQSRAYAQKVKITNLQQMAQTYAFVKKHGFASIEELENALNEAKAKTSAARSKLKATESRLNDVNKQIRLTGQFYVNRDVYTKYRQSKKSEEFYEKHRAEITLYETARDNLREMSGGQKLPSMKSLKEEKDRLVTSKNAEYEAYQNARTEQRDLQTIYTNVRKMLGLDDDRKTTHTVDKGLG